jgi:RNA polymerase sigma factor (sigma-70 family)
MDAAGYYKENLQQINEAISIICRKHGMARDEEMDFAQHVHLQLIENDYGKLRAFKGASSLKTYLYTVISRIFIDTVRSKWHPSAEAKKMGAAAVALEKLVHRNQYAVHEACQILAANPATAIEESAAHAMLGKLKVRKPRLARVDDSEAHLQGFPDPAPDPEKRIAQKQLQQKKQTIIALVGDITRSLSGEDKLLIKLLFVSNRKISEVARLLGKEDRMLYKRTQAILRNMREAMADAGIREGDVREILDSMGECND